MSHHVPASEDTLVHFSYASIRRTWAEDLGGGEVEVKRSFCLYLETGTLEMSFCRFSQENSVLK